jgi:phosphopantothenoylcysteine decarboxylase/phosphopantothenate--cysteine ligase
MDQVRRLTNFSTGRLGAELASFLAGKGHTVTLLLGEQATYPCEPEGFELQSFSTTTDLRDRLRALAKVPTDAVYHAAAVSDFMFGRICARSENGELTEVRSGKISTRQGALWAELVPTPKIISELGGWFAGARLVGWKYEVEGGRPDAIRQAQAQIHECRTTACVANGPAYGSGFGLVNAAGDCTHLESRESLFQALLAMLGSRK